MPTSQQIMEEARTLIPGGVNSPVRAFAAVGGTPVVIESASGARIRDVEGREYIDYVGSWGPMIVGHTHPRVVEALQKACARGASFGAPTVLENQLARLIVEIVPSIEKVRMVNSGTEATLSAVRVARGFTGRNKIVKFEGCYHGHSDSFLIAAGSGAATLGVPNSPGVTPGAAVDTLLASYNDLESVAVRIRRYPGEIAAVIVEPVAGNMGVVPPEPGFLEGLREICTREGIVLIFDEVMTGFRVALGGAQELYGVRPDMTTLGKIIGGGLPVGAYGGRADIMAKVAPEGPVYQAGTLSGNPLAMTAGIETLKLLREPGFYEALEAHSARLEAGTRQNLKDLGLDLYTTRVGSMSCLFFTPERVTSWKTAAGCNTKAYAVYFHAMLDRGVYLAPAQFEAAFVSAAHTDADVDATLAAQREALIAAKAVL
ncbi:MAG TPA: glutamate-1-semialdehyde 2,1-aminomutase [Candidatus Sumerlaeota bacterium]|nr:glutamate-1-semialdehyde 2,1-aminomutase [Candidatus Sumerlaeota bacterium]